MRLNLVVIWSLFTRYMELIYPMLSSYPPHCNYEIKSLGPPHFVGYLGNHLRARHTDSVVGQNWVLRRSEQPSNQTSKGDNERKSESAKRQAEKLTCMHVCVLARRGEVPPVPTIHHMYCWLKWGLHRAGIMHEMIAKKYKGQQVRGS